MTANDTAPELLSNDQVTVTQESRPPVLPAPLTGQPTQPDVTALSSQLQARLRDVLDGRAQVIPLRDEWLNLLNQPLNTNQMLELKEALGQLSQLWLWEPKIHSGDQLCTTYHVNPGDQLATIARKFHIPWELIGKINAIDNPSDLKAYQPLKIPQGPFHAVVYKSSFTMDIYLKDTYVRSYEVGLARPGKVTPTGLWLVEGRMRAAPWTDPETGRTYQPSHPDYPLGPVWIPLKGISGDAAGQPSYGIHGTNEPESIGTASSSGCVRMRNHEAEQVYLLLQPGESYVRILD